MSDGCVQRIASRQEVVPIKFSPNIALPGENKVLRLGKRLDGLLRAATR